ncbi:MAG: MCE family protein [Chlorobiales bacterium]|nr:MCE family protein [Chlorobiales bacterium]
MKFKFKYTDKIVGAFVLTALAVVLVIAVVIAVNNKFFENKYAFKTQFADAVGLTATTPIYFKGYEIGKIGKFSLNERNLIDVEFLIYEEYRNRIRTTSVISKSRSVMSGTTMIDLLQAEDLGQVLPENEFVPALDTPEGIKRARAQNIKITGDVLASMMTNLDNILYKLNKDNNPEDGAIFRTLVNLADASENLNSVMKNLDYTMAKLNGEKEHNNGTLFRTMTNIADLTQQLKVTAEQLNKTLATTDTVLKAYQNPDGLAARMLDPSGEKIVKPLGTTLTKLSTTLTELNTLLSYMNTQTSDMTTLVGQTKQTLRYTQKAMEGMSNNPFLKGGITPEYDPNPVGDKLRLNNLEEGRDAKH